MDREEIIKEIGDIMRESDECDRMRGFDTCDHCCHKDEKGACVFNRYIAYEIADFLISHEENLLKEFVEYFKQILNKEIWECEDEIDCEIHCGSLAPEELEVWKAQRQVDIKRLKWTVENIDFELKLFLEERK